MRAEFVFRAAWAPLLAMGLTACATTRGAPLSVFDAGALVVAAQTSYAMKTVDDYMADSANDPAEKKLYRNKVIQAYLGAIDARYYQFRADLGIEGRGGALGFDLVALGLATAGSLSTGAAPELAAAAGLATGTRAAIDKNLLYEKTLPAIFAAMDSARLRQRTVILDRMKAEYLDYPMEAAWNDLQAYQVAGTFDDAVTQVTDRAAADRESARAAYNRSLGLACDATAEIVPLRTELGNVIFEAATKASAADAQNQSKGRESLRRIALAFSVNDPGRVLASQDDIDNFRDDILNKIEVFYCSADELRRTVQVLTK